MMKMTPNEWRKRHKRCGTCIYWRGDPLERKPYCKVKQINRTLKKGRFCKIYKAEEFEE